MGTKQPVDNSVVLLATVNSSIRIRIVRITLGAKALFAWKFSKDLSKLSAAEQFEAAMKKFETLEAHFL